MRRQTRQASQAHMGRRLTAAALAAVMGAGCVAMTPFRALAEDTGSTGYEIYPNPHVMTYTGGDYIVKNEVNVVFEDGIDQYTKDRLDEVLDLKGDITYTTSDEMVNGKTNILVGINGSGGYVDSYAKENLEVTTDGLFDELDSYVLDNQNGVITVLGRDTDASFYGLTTLYHVFTQMDSYTIQEFHVEDWADVASRGFIEGYYGNPWSTEDRANLMTWGGYYKLNSYFYAPKDDPKHNSNWRELYTQEELETKIKPLAEAGNASKCRFVFALHPFMYNAVRFNTEENYQADLKIVQDKFAQVIGAGVRQIAILADDAGNVGSTNYIRFLNDMTQWLQEMQKTYPDLKQTLPFCTVEYMGRGESYYAQFPENVQIVMTGGKVWGEVSDNFTSTFTQNTGRGPYMWINWPCTDNSKKHLIMGGYSDFLQIGVDPDNIQGIVLNPMQQSEPSKVAIFGNACYSWNIWETQKEADKAWDASFACVDHNTVIPNDASNALRELSKHMINQAMDGRVRVLQESVELKPILNSFKEKLTAGTVTEQDVDAVMAEFLVLQEAAKTYRAKAGDQNLSEQIVYWINCWDDTTEAAIAYLNGVKAVLAGDTTNILKYNTEGKTAFDSSKNHPFWYLDHNEYAEVGVQHIVPFINTLATYVSGYAETAMDPTKVITTFITNRTDTPTGDVANIFDGSDSTGMTFKTPNAIAEGEYVGLLYNKVIDVNNIRITMQGQADHFEHSKLQYTTDGKEWVDIELREGENQFDVPRNQPFEISLDEDALPQDFQAMGVRLITTQANSGACWLDLREFQINAQDSEPEVTEGTYSTNRDRMNGTAWDVLNDGANGGASASEVWLSVASGTDKDGLPAGSYIQYTLTEPMKLTSVTFAQGGSAAGDVITDGSIQYLDAQGQWQTIAEVNGDKVQTFDFSDEDITTTAVRVQNDAFKKIWWRVGEFNVEFSADTSSKPIEYNIMRTDRWAVYQGNEASLYDGNDSTYVWYDPDGSGNTTGDDFMVDDFLGYNLGKVAKLDSAHIVVGNGDSSDKLKVYTIETSVDGQEWTAVPDYERYEGKASGTDVLDIDLDGVQAQYIRIRNLVQQGSWGKFSEFTVTEVLNQSGSTDNLYTNVETNILSNASEGQVNLTSGTATLNTGDYVGVDLGNIKAVTGVTTSQLPENVTLETSMNGVTWTPYTAKSAIDARYVRAVATADSVKLDITEFVVTYEFVAEKSVESDFAKGSDSRDVRTLKNVANAFDGKLGTYVEITGSQDQGKHITFDLGQVIHFESLRYYIIETHQDYLRHALFEVSVDGKDWTPVMTVGKQVDNVNDTTVAKDADYLTHDSKNPGYMYADAGELNVDGRYIRITPQSTYSHKWVYISELMINGGAYISPEANRDIVSTVVEEAGKIPSNALDGNYTTTYKPSEANGSFTYRISEPTGLTSIRLVQLGAISNATVTAQYVGEDAAVELGTLSQAINEFKLDTGKTLESITVSWTDTIPEIAEIVTSTQAVGQVNKDELKAALDATQPTDTWTDDSVAAYEVAKAVAQAMYENDNVTQSMVDSALGSLNSAVNNAVLKASNVDELQGLVDNKVTNDNNVYTTFSFMTYSSAMEDLEAALADAGNLSQEKADQLKAAVEEAQAGLVYSTRNRELAQLAVAGYENIVAEDYTAESYAAVTAAKQAIDELVAQDLAATSNDQRVNPVKFLEAKAAYEAAVDALVPAGEAQPGNKDLLQKTYEYALTLSTEGVTDSAKAAFEAAVANAKTVLDDANATQDEINAAWDALLEGIWGLGLTQGDKSMLEQLIAKAESMLPDEDKYVADNWQMLVDALDAAKKVMEDGDAMDEDIQPVAEDLLNAILAQRFKADKSILEELIAKAEAIDLDGYNDASVGAFRSALAAAQAVMADESLTEDDQAKVDTAVMNLLTAMENLTAEGEMPTDKPNQTPAPDATNTPDNGQVPPTGDGMNLTVYLLVAVVCAAGLAVLAIFRKKNA